MVWQSRPTSGRWAVRLTEQQYADLMRSRSVPPPTPKKSKFKNKRCQSACGKWFDSQLERDYYYQLLLRWKAGDILWFVRQVTFELEGGVKYRADFVVVTAAGVEVVDTTGVMTQVKANKLKQVKARYGIEVQIVRSV
jgi:hypothetical protein